MKATKFKVGDKVRIMRKGRCKGRIVTVVHRCWMSYMVKYKRPPVYDWYHERELEAK